MRFHTRNVLLACGVAASVAYVGTDTLCASRYEGYSFTDQAVSELFAIGAPTSGLAVVGFSVSSLLLLAFAAGIWRASGGSRSLRIAALAFGASAVVGLALWNAFPMHMRGAEPGFTDTMHLILATNPFVLISIAACLVAFRGAFRLYTAATILVLVITAMLAFEHAPNVAANLPTPNLGLNERVAQYAFELWQIVLAIVLLDRPYVRPHIDGQPSSHARA